jgi:mono/diheme cytochrome c family protein
MMRSRVLVAGVLGVMSVSMSAQDARQVETGKELYAAKQCARCHRVAGKGYKDGKLDGVASKLSIEEMRRWLQAPAEMEAGLDPKPKVKMSSRKSMRLTEAEISSLVAYLRTLK